MLNKTINEIERNLFLINQKINQACKLYNKDKPQLVAVSKMQDSKKISEAINFGCSAFGENYIKEAEEKWLEIKGQFPQVKLHFVGHLQSNKAKNAVRIFDVIESLDNEKLALALKKEIEKQQKNIEIFIQVNIGEEPQKSGIVPHELKDFVKFSRKECGLNVTGLMCIAPLNESPSPYFALLNKLAKENNLKNLSMGMSSDFEEAIALGASYVRIGSAIFGERK
jgi:pyridoxal phosphate enzyme (YggS family)